MSTNAPAGDISVIPASIALCRRPRTSVARPTRLTNFPNGSAHAQPADPRTSLSTLSFLALAARSRLRISALRRLSHPPAKPPCRFSDRQGSWFEPTWRDGGVEPSTPSWSSSRTDGGRSTSPSRCREVQPPFHAPRAPHLTSTTTRAHAQPRYTYPQSSPPHILLCLCSLVGAGPVSRRLLAPDADADADANGADDVIDDGSDGGDGSEDAATHATTPAFDADAARRCRRRLRPPKPLLPTYPPPRLHPSPPPATPLRRAPSFATAFTNAATQPTPHRPAATDPPCAPPSLSCFCLCLVRRLVECRRGVSMCAACCHIHLATCVCSCNMMLAQVTHAPLAPRATDRSPLAARPRPRRGLFFERDPRSRELSGDHRHVALCSRWWHGSKDNSREVSGPL